MMRTDAGFHADQARRRVGKAGLDLATRPFLTQHNRATLIVAHDVERVLADIDTNHGNCSVLCLGHGVLLVLTPLPSFYCWRGGGTGRPAPSQTSGPTNPGPPRFLGPDTDLPSPAPGGKMIH